MKSEFWLFFLSILVILKLPLESLRITFTVEWISTTGCRSRTTWCSRALMIFCFFFKNFSTLQSSDQIIEFTAATILTTRGTVVHRSFLWSFSFHFALKVVRFYEIEILKFKKICFEKTFLELWQKWKSLIIIKKVKQKLVTKL